MERVRIMVPYRSNQGDQRRIVLHFPRPVSEFDHSGIMFLLVNLGADKRLWASAVTTCFFEGSMYLWVFFKFPALRLAHQLDGKGSDLPFGMIFAALMCAMMLGSIFFTWYSAQLAGRWVFPASTLLSLSLMVAACSFLVPVLIRDEEIVFWCFCIFEMCVGIYYPTMSNLKEKFVNDSVRAKSYGALRVPLNVFVVVGLGLTKDGE